MAYGKMSNNLFLLIALVSIKELIKHGCGSWCPRGAGFDFPVELHLLNFYASCVEWLDMEREKVSTLFTL